MNVLDHPIGVPALMLGALAYFLVCATVGSAVVSFHARGWSAWHSVRLSFGVWAKPALAFFFAYAVLFFDTGSGDLSIFFFAPFLVVGCCLLSTALTREGVAQRFPGSGATSVLLIFIATVALCFRVAI